MRISEWKSLNITRSKLEIWVLKASKKANEAWQEKLLIVTERRMFLISRKEEDLNNDDEDFTFGQSAAAPCDSAVSYEIVDSIPMEEIISIQFCSDSNSWGSEEKTSMARPRTLAARLLRRLLDLMDAALQTLVGDIDADSDADADARPRLSAQADRADFERRLCESLPEDAGDYLPRALRVATAPSGFNQVIPITARTILDRTDRHARPGPARPGRRGCGGRQGQTYYFLLRKGDYPYFRTSDVMEARPLVDEQDGAEFARKVARLAAKYRDAFRRKTRFTRLQQRLHKVLHDM